MVNCVSEAEGVGFGLFDVDMHDRIVGRGTSVGERWWEASKWKGRGT